jgi:predicted RNA-binding protein with PIN domain
MRVLVVDAANVVGSRPDGWWKDRAAAARRLHEVLLTADVPHDRVVMVLEGQAKGGVRAGRDGDVLTVHAPKDGDTTIIEQVRRAVDAGDQVTAITADRVLAARLDGLGARSMSPSWLLDLLG